ncbi:MAG: hypothetical protein ACOYON_16285 [Fimbriimonas sp.]
MSKASHRRRRCQGREEGQGEEVTAMALAIDYFDRHLKGPEAVLFRIATGRSEEAPTATELVQEPAAVFVATEGKLTAAKIEKIKADYAKYIGRGKTVGVAVWSVVKCNNGITPEEVFAILGIKKLSRKGVPNPRKNRDELVRKYYDEGIAKGLSPNMAVTRLLPKFKRISADEAREILGIEKEARPTSTPPRNTKYDGMTREEKIRAIYAGQMEKGRTQQEAVRMILCYVSKPRFTAAEVRSALGIPEPAVVPKAPKAKVPKPITGAKHSRTIERAEYSSAERGVEIDTSPKPDGRKFKCLATQSAPRPTAEVIPPGPDVFRSWGDIAPEKRWECVLKANYTPEEMEKYIVGPGQGVTALVNALAIDNWLRSQPVSARLRAEEIARSRILEEQL